MSGLFVQPEQVNVELHGKYTIVDLKFVVEHPMTEETKRTMDALLDRQPMIVEALGVANRKFFSKAEEESSAKEDHQSDPNWGTW